MTTVTLHVGTYAKAGGRGLQRVDYDADAGFTLGAHDPVAQNASFGAWSSRHGYHFLVNEQSAGMLGAYRRAGDEWAKLAEVTSEGREPCYAALAPDEDRVAIANYASGNVTLIALDPNGLPQGEVAVWANDGHGPDRDRQEGPHVHCVQFSRDGQSLYAVDLGTDQILRFALDGTTDLHAPDIAWQAPAGSGPRHLLFHPTYPLALLVSELDSMLTLFDATADRLAPLVRCRTLPDTDAEDNLGGHLGLDGTGTRVYVTNRGHDSIAVFALDPAARTLARIQCVASGGASPRFFLSLEDQARLIVVNEKAGNLIAFEVQSDGRLHPTSHAIDVPGAAFAFVTND